MQRSTPGAACLRRFGWPPCLRLCSCQTDGPSEPETSTRCWQSLLLIFSNTASLPSQSFMQDANSYDDPLPATGSQSKCLEVRAGCARRGGDRGVATAPGIAALAAAAPGTATNCQEVLRCLS